MYMLYAIFISLSLSLCVCVCVCVCVSVRVRTDAFKGYDLNNSGYLSRDELRSMFKAYFLLSMELVRDLVKALEEELVSTLAHHPDMHIHTSIYPYARTCPPPCVPEYACRSDNILSVHVR